MSKEMDFFIYLLEAYAQEKGRLASDVMREWERLNLIQVIFDNYLMYHTEALDNAFADIDSLVKTGRPLVPGSC